MKRIREIDYLRGVLIILMVLFHLVYIGDTYPNAKRIVYSFHMPAFLIISGYLTNADKTPRSFARSMMWIAVPYAIMESFYIAGASYFPIREHIDDLTLAVFFDKLMLHPLGLYWYLHTLIICSSAYYIVVCRLKRLDLLGRLILCGMLLFLLSCFGIVGFSNATYYIIGVAIRQKGLSFGDIFKPHLLCLMPIPFLCCSDNLNSSTIEGYAMTYFVMCSLLCSYKWRTVYPFVFIGRNTLPIVLFSPLFTILAKSFQPFMLDIDNSGILFAVIAVTFVFAGCFLIAYTIDTFGITKFFIGREKLFLSKTWDRKFLKNQ